MALDETYRHYRRTFNNTHTHFLDTWTQSAPYHSNFGHQICIRHGAEKRVSFILNIWSINGNLLNFIKHFLTDRKISVKVYDYLSSTHSIENGLHYRYNCILYQDMYLKIIYTKKIPKINLPCIKILFFCTLTNNSVTNYLHIWLKFGSIFHFFYHFLSFLIRCNDEG